MLYHIHVFENGPQRIVAGRGLHCAVTFLVQWHPGHPPNKDLSLLPSHSVLPLGLSAHGGSDYIYRSMHLNVSFADCSATFQKVWHFVVKKV